MSRYQIFFQHPCQNCGKSTTGIMDFAPGDIHTSIDLFECQWCKHKAQVFWEVRVRASVIDNDRFQLVPVDTQIMPVWDGETIDEENDPTN